MMDLSIYPTVLKLARITSVFKKSSKTLKENYRPVSILPNISKFHERCIYKQISIYFNKFFSKCQYGFRLGFGAIHCLLVMEVKKVSG